MKTNLPFYLALLLLTQCSKCKDDPTPTDQAARLPPATQTGANTFGCLVNGQPYTPGGNNGTPNYAVLYEPGPNGATLNILTYRISAGNRQYMTISCGPVTQPRQFSLDIPATEGAAGYVNTEIASPCNSFEGNNLPNFRRGHLIITRLDLQAGIISGTFAFTLAKPGCDTIRITDGRFDWKM